MARGRPRKPGKRYKSGDLKPVYDKGSERIAAASARFGTHYSSALGRAYAAGLLGDGDRAFDRLNGGKKFAQLYTRTFGGTVYRCALDRSPRGPIEDPAQEDPQRDQMGRDWLAKVMRELDGAGCRPWLDQLISSAYVDTGPQWLDRLILGCGKKPDQTLLDAAIAALDILAPPKRSRIRAANYHNPG